MKVTKRDRNLLMLLGVFILFALIYFFVISPLEQNNAALDQEIIQKSNRVDEITQMISKRPAIEDQINTTYETIHKLANDFYPRVNQQEFIYQINALNESQNLEINNIVFNYRSEDESGEQVLKGSFDLNGTYSDILQYINNLENQLPKASIGSLNFNNDGTGLVKGNMEVSIEALPRLAAYIDASQNYVAENDTNYNDNNNPFKPYEGYIEEETPKELPQSGNTEIIIPKYSIYDFESSEVFFVGNPKDVTGQVSRSANAISGKYGLDIAYNFNTLKADNMANIVFDGDPIIVTNPVQTIGLWAYAYQATNHEIGIVIEDAAGRDFKVPIITNVNWTGWQETSIAAPEGMTYPFVIKRCYITAPDYETALNGHVILDKLEVTYPEK